MRRIGSWEIGARLRRGNHGVFFETRDRLMAVKVADRHADDRSFGQFANEIELLAALQGTGVVELVEAGSHRGRLFYVTPRYRTLPFCKPEGLSTLADVARALGRLHDRGIAHRDIRRLNIRVGGGGRLADFGLAVSATPSRRTAGLGVLGSLPYLDPDVVRGETSGPPADVWGLGVVLHEWATGRGVWPGLDRMDLPSALSHVTHEEPIVSVDGPIAAVVDRCLAPRAERLDATGVLEALESLSVHPGGRSRG